MSDQLFAAIRTRLAVAFVCGMVLAGLGVRAYVPAAPERLQTMVMVDCHQHPEHPAC
jgi:hypothetical protein